MPTQMRRLLLGVMIAASAAEGLAAECGALRARALICTAEERLRTQADFDAQAPSPQSDEDTVKSYYVAASAEWLELVRAGCATATDYVYIAKLHMEERDWRSAEGWCALAVSTADETGGEPPDARLMWGEALLASGYSDAAKVQLIAAAKGDGLRRFTELGQPESWLEASPSVYRALMAYADLAQDEPTVGDIYHRAAAMIALKSGFVAAQRPYYDYEDTIAAFSFSDRLVPVDSQPIPIQMTVWRTLAIGEAHVGSLDPAMEAIEKLFSLCHLDPVGPTPCPTRALIPLPLFRGTFFERHLSLVSEWYLIDQNMQALGYIVSKAFSSVSWDPKTGFPRQDAADTDFFGARNVDGYPNGRVSPEEDRVETELLLDHGNREAWLAHTKGRFEPYVKKFLANLARDIWSGRPEVDEAPVFLGRTLTGLEAEVSVARASGKVSDWTWDAFRTGRRAHYLMLTLIDRLNERFYGFREPYGNPVWESYIGTLRFRSVSALLILRELSLTIPNGP